MVQILINKHLNFITNIVVFELQVVYSTASLQCESWTYPATKVWLED